MSPEPAPRLEPRLVVAAVALGLLFLVIAGQILLGKAAGQECEETDHSQVGGVTQLFVPGDGCAERPGVTGP